jgi:hypothetical protein
MRFLNISGPDVMKDEEFCPNCHVRMDERDGYKFRRLCYYDRRHKARMRRAHRQHR